MTESKVKATIYLPEGVHRRLKIRAAELGSSMTDLVLQAVEELLQQPPASPSPEARLPKSRESR